MPGVRARTWRARRRCRPVLRPTQIARLKRCSHYGNRKVGRRHFFAVARLGAARRTAMCQKTVALNGRPRCVPTTSTSMFGFPLRQYRQSTAPSHFVYTAVCLTERGHRRPRDRPKAHRQRLEAHSLGTARPVLWIQPRTALLSATIRLCSTSPRNGEPRVITEAIRFGLRTAADRAKIPPRLCPMRCTGRPVSAYARSIVSSRCRERRSGQWAAMPIPE